MNFPGRTLIALSLTVAFASATADDMVWREVDPDNVVFIEMNHGTVVIELNPLFAPATVKQFRRLVQERFYDGLSFYRVIDGFVAQGGDGSDLGALSQVPLIEAEFEMDWLPDLSWMEVQEDDLFAPETGFIDGFAAGRDPKKELVWLLHCPGAVAMARGDEPDSSRTDFYIVMGHAPRYLDRNLNIFGRVVFGMDVVQAIQRGPADANGIIPNDADATRIRRARLASDIPREERLSAYVMDSNSKAFKDYLKDRRNRRQAFFHNRPPRVLDICQIPVSGRITK